MADMKKIATRDSYGKAITQLGAEHNDIVVMDADLAGSTKSGVFRKEFPNRHFNCGIAEGNMMAVAAGMAAMGLVPYVSSFAMFAAGRGFEQIRNSIGYPHLNVKIVASHGGISVGEDGASHQCCEDFALMRSIPGMVVMSPADDVEAKAMVKAAYEYVGPVYMRFGRAAVPVVHEVGGLYDTIKPYGAGGNGFTFAAYNADDMGNVIYQATELYKDKEAWKKLVRKIMRTDFSWKASAEKYVGLYEKVINQ